MAGRGEGYTRRGEGRQVYSIYMYRRRDTPPVQYELRGVRGEDLSLPSITDMIIRLHTVDAAWNLAFENW